MDIFRDKRRSSDMKSTTKIECKSTDLAKICFSETNFKQWVTTEKNMRKDHSLCSDTTTAGNIDV